MDLTIHTYGHIDAMFYILNGIAMIMNSSFADMMIKTMAMTATFYYGVKAAYASSAGSAKQHLVKVAAMVLVINGLLVPKTSMLVEDHVTKQRDKVDNLPYGFAVPVGFMEKFGDILTAAFEQGFTTVGSSNYRDYGMVFGARLIGEARNFKIKTPEFAYNMNNFIRRCVVLDASMGSKYTINDLFQSDDIWTLVKTHASPLRRVEIRDKGKNELLTCKYAATGIIEPAFKSEVDEIIQKYAKTEFSLAGSISGIFIPRGTATTKNYFKKNLGTAFGEYLGSTNTAETNLKQYMMMNSMSNYARTYGFARASMTQESNWRIAGDLANMYLPMLLSIMKGLVYASFIFMVPIMLMQGGMSKYLCYISVVASLQLWPALNAVLNMFIDLYSSSQMQDLAGSGISFTSYSTIGDYSDKIVAVASGLQMTIPFLAFSIVQGGVSGFIHLASNITGASSAAASSAAQEVVTGNKSFDNYSAGNMQVAMQQGFKTDWNSSYKDGASEIQLSNGTMQRVLLDGSTLLQSGVGMTMSGGGVKLNMREVASSQASHHVSDAQNLLQAEQRSYHEADRETFSKTANYVSTIAQRASMGESFDYSKIGEHGKAMQKAVNQIHTLRENYGYGWDQATSMVLKGGGNISAPGAIGKLAGGLLDKAGVPGVGKVGGDISIGVDGSLSASNSSSQSFGDDTQVNREQFTREDYNNVVKAASNEQFATSNNIDKSYSDDVRRSYEKQKSAEIAMNTQADRVESLSKAYQRIQSMDGSYGRDMYDVVQKNIADTYGVSSLDAHKMIETHDPRATKVWKSMVDAEINSLVGGKMSAEQIKFSDANRQKFLQDAGSQYRGNIETAHTKDVAEYAAAQGIDPNDLSFVNNNLQTKVEDMRAQNDAAYNKMRNENETKEQVRQAAVHKYEEDRIGQGKVGDFVGIGGPTNLSTTSATEGKSQVTEIATQIPQGTKK